MLRRPAEVGLYIRTPIAYSIATRRRALHAFEHVNRVASSQRDYCFLPATGVASPNPAATHLATHVDGGDVGDRHVENRRDGRANFWLGGILVDLEAVFVQLHQVGVLLGD